MKATPSEQLINLVGVIIVGIVFMVWSHLQLK